MPSDEAESAKNRRRSHRKSRFGCGNCKRRRIKCDESRPSCANCIRRQVRCEFREDTSSPVNDPTDDPTDDPNVSGRDGGLPTPNSQGTNSNHATPSVPTLQQEYGPVLATFISNNRLPWQSTTRIAERPRDSPILDSPPPALDCLDLELLHHYTTSPDLSENHMWRINVPKVSFSNHYLAHYVLSLSAFHLSRQSESVDRAQDLRSRAEQHYSTAMKSFIPQLSRVNKDNCAAIYLSSTLLSHIYFSRGPTNQPGQYIAFSTSGEAEWLTFLRGVQNIVETMGDTFKSALHELKLYTTSLSSYRDYKEHDEVLMLWGRRRKQQELRKQEGENVAPDYTPHFAKLRRFIETFAAEESSFQKYLTALNSLEGIFDRRYREELESRDEIPSLAASPSALLFSWLYLLSSDFIACLSQKRPIALVIFSYYAILIKDEAKYLWLLEGWGEHVMSGVWEYLHPEYRNWVEWPVAEIGWKGV